LTGEDAVEIFKASKLESEKLASVWDWSDLNRDGQLSSDEWLVACHLLRHLKTGQLTSTQARAHVLKKRSNLMYKFLCQNLFPISIIFTSQGSVIRNLAQTLDIIVHSKSGFETQNDAKC
jgi:hypothetical protein